jgi:hypothetical protein
VEITAWGLLGPEMLASERRTRALGLGATVRSFNDLADPGLPGAARPGAAMGIATRKGSSSSRGGRK